MAGAASNPKAPAAPHAGQTSAAAAPLAGLGLMVLGMTLIPGIDAIAKYLGQPMTSADGVTSPGVPAVQSAWARFFFQTLIVAPLALALLGLSGLRPRRWGLMILRGVCIALATLCFFSALQVMPLAETIAIFFVEPLLLTLLSAVVLRERIGIWRIGAVLAGFSGALLIIQPNFAAVGWTAALPLLAAAFFATYLLLTKILVAGEPPLALHLWAGLVGSLVLSLAMGVGVFWSEAGVSWLAPVAPNAAQWGLLALLGVIATAGHFLVVLAFQRAPASLLAPFQYWEIVMAVALGYLVFQELPRPETWAGVAIVVGSGLVVIWRERVRAGR